MNRVDLIGRTTSDIELRTTQGGTKICRFTLAVKREYSKEDKADFIPCTAFNNLAEILSKYVKKGHRIAVTGRIQTGSYVKDNGETVWKYEVIAENMEFLEQKKDRKEELTVETDTNERYEIIDNDEDLPF